MHHPIQGLKIVTPQLPHGSPWPETARKSRPVRGELHSTEVDLLTRSGSVADPMAKLLLTTPGKSWSVKVQRQIRFTCEAPPLKRKDGVGRPPWTTP